MQVVFHLPHPTFEEWLMVVRVGAAFIFTIAEVEKRSFATSAEAPFIAYPSGKPIGRFALVRRKPKT